MQPFRASQRQVDVVVKALALPNHQQNMDGAAKLTRRKPPLAMFPDPPKCFSQYATSGTALPPTTAHTHCVNICSNAQEVHHKAIHCPRRSDHLPSQPLPRLFQANQKGHPSHC